MVMCGYECRGDPIGCLAHIMSYMPFMPHDAIVGIWKAFTPAQYQQLARTHSADLISLMTRVGRPTIDPVVDQLLDSPDAPNVSSAVAQDVKDKLLGFQSVENKSVWKEMTKAADSNNVAERNQAYTALFEACIAQNNVTL